jgi:predicted ester cyclase
MTTSDFETFLRSVYAEGRPWGTPEMLDEFYDRSDADLVFTRPPFPPVVGLEANRKDDEAMADAFSNQRVHIEEIISCEETAVLRYTWEGDHTGVSPTLGIPPTGKHVETSGCTVYHLREGKMVDIVDYLDLLTLLTQVGVIPAMS